MDLGLTDRWAFVAGASAGLGFAVAAQLALEGCHVAICSRDKNRIEQAAERIAVTGVDVLPIVCDVRKEGDIARAFDNVRSTRPALDILVTNAGGPSSGFVSDFDANDWRDALELNLISTINLCRHALPLLRAGMHGVDPLGRILMISSVSAKQPIPSLYLSNVSRAGVLGFAKSLSEELGPEGITVNTILPGYTDTERLRELAGYAERKSGRPVEVIQAEWAEDTALKRLGAPEEFAAAAVFLLSRPAAFITGVSLAVDGGRTKGLL